MKIERRLQFAIAVMASMGTLLLGMGSANILLPMAAILVATSSLYLTDKYHWVELNRNVASLAAVAAVCLSVVDFFQLGRERQLLAIAYLLIYLQIVLMYQRKDVRVYWQLLMLSLLQVVVASALNFGLGFGIMLIVYMFVGLFALSVFFNYREVARVRGPSREDWARKPQSPWRRLTIVNEIVGQERIAAREEDATVGLWERTIRVGMGTLICTFGMFLLMPRFGDDLSIRRITAGRMVGFNDTVELGTLGEAFENPEAVMRVWFRHPRTDKPYKIHTEPLFRGTILTDYAKGKWRLDVISPQDRSFLIRDLPDSNVPRVNVEIGLEPQHEDTVCAVYPLFSTGQKNMLEFHEKRQQVIRTTSSSSKFEAKLCTTAFENGLQKHITPVSRIYDALYIDHRTQTLFEFMRKKLTNYPGKGDEDGPLKNVVALTNRILADSGLTAEDIVGRARSLEQHLKASGDYEYQLGSVGRSLQIDPVEDFVVNNPRGHCEYFASALTLMLRSQGIPARMVVGFKGGEWNSLGGYYQVRQLHAHSWVEAFVENLPPTSGMQTNAGWLRLDPTPGSNEADELMEAITLADRISEWANFAEFIWSTYVVDLDAKRQQEGIYVPLATMIDIGRTLATKQFWAEALPDAIIPEQDEETTASGGGWFNRRVGVLSIFLLLLLLCAIRLRARLSLRCRWRRTEEGTGFGLRRTQVISFYRRLEIILRKNGFVRPSGQTQHEFAVAAAGQMIESPTRAAVAPIPRKIVEMFYRVRFGGVTLTQTQREEIDVSLGQLERALQDQS